MSDRTTSPLAVVAVGNSGMQIIDRQGEPESADPSSCDCGPFRCLRLRRPLPIISNPSQHHFLARARRPAGIVLQETGLSMGCRHLLA